MGQVHGGAAGEVVVYAHVGVAGQRLETRQVAARETVHVARGEAHEQHGAVRDVLSTRDAQSLADDLGHAMPGESPAYRRDRE